MGWYNIPFRVFGNGVCGMWVFSGFCGFRFGVGLWLLCLVVCGCYVWLVGFVIMDLMALWFWVLVWLLIVGVSDWCDMLSG